MFEHRLHPCALRIWKREHAIENKSLQLTDVPRILQLISFHVRAIIDSSSDCVIPSPSDTITNQFAEMKQPIERARIGYRLHLNTRRQLSREPFIDRMHRIDRVRCRSYNMGSPSIRAEVSAKAKRPHRSCCGNRRKIVGDNEDALHRFTIDSVAPRCLPCILGNPLNTTLIRGKWMLLSIMWPAHTKETTRVQQRKAAPDYPSRSKTKVLAHELRQDLKFRNVE